MQSAADPQNAASNPRPLFLELPTLHSVIKHRPGDAVAAASAQSWKAGFHYARFTLRLELRLESLKN